VFICVPSFSAKENPNLDIYGFYLVEDVAVETSELLEDQTSDLVSVL
jgi:hypothetical protein